MTPTFSDPRAGSSLLYQTVLHGDDRELMLYEQEKLNLE